MKQKITLRLFLVGSASAIFMFIFALLFRNNISAMITCLAAACIFAAIAGWFITRDLLLPIDNLAQDIESGTMDGHNAIYRELAPLIAQIRSQKAAITEQIAEIEGEKTKFSSITQYMNEGLIILDSHKRVLMINDSASKYLSFTSNRSNVSLVEICRNIPLNEAVSAAILGNKTTVSLERSGRVLDIFVSPVFEQNAISGAVCIILDITEKAQLDNIKQEFTANVSHELKTPLTTILGYAEMMETGMAKSADTPAMAATIHREATRMLALISDILRLSQLDEGAIEMKKEPVDLILVAQKCADSLAQNAKTHDVTINVVGTSCIVSGDEKMLYELIYNLCDNAIRYNRPGGHVRITAEKNQLCVADTGIGIPEICKNRIFERFFRVDKSRSKETGGTGLGLAIVKHIAMCHKATIDLTSREDSGTSITVQF